MNTTEEMEQKLFESKLLHAVRNFKHGRLIAEDIISLAEKLGYFDNIKFGNQRQLTEFQKQLFKYK